jgi:hypothetical protein
MQAFAAASSISFVQDVRPEAADACTGDQAKAMPAGRRTTLPSSGDGVQPPAFIVGEVARGHVTRRHETVALLGELPDLETPPRR